MDQADEDRRVGAAIRIIESFLGSGDFLIPAQPRTTETAWFVGIGYWFNHEVEERYGPESPSRVEAYEAFAAELVAEKTKDDARIAKRRDYEARRKAKRLAEAAA